MRRLIAAFLALTLVGCLAEDPSSFREVTGLLSGQWTMVDDPPDPPTVYFLPDGTFTSTSSGVPGALTPNYNGHYWQTAEVIAFRGTGFIESGAAGSVPGVRVQFVWYRITENPAAMTMRALDKAYVEDLIGVTDLNELTNSDVESALRRLDGLPLPDTSLGFTFEFFK